MVVFVMMAPHFLQLEARKILYQIIRISGKFQKSIKTQNVPRCMKGWAIFRMFSSYAQQGRRRYRVGAEIPQLQTASASVSAVTQLKRHNFNKMFRWKTFIVSLKLLGVVFDHGLRTNHSNGKYEFVSICVTVNFKISRIEKCQFYRS